MVFRRSSGPSPKFETSTASKGGSGDNARSVPRLNAPSPPVRPPTSNAVSLNDSHPLNISGPRGQSSSGLKDGISIATRATSKNGFRDNAKSIPRLNAPSPPLRHPASNIVSLGDPYTLTLPGPRSSTPASKDGINIAAIATSKNGFGDNAKSVPRLNLPPLPVRRPASNIVSPGDPYPPNPSGPRGSTPSSKDGTSIATTATSEDASEDSTKSVPYPDAPSFPVPASETVVSSVPRPPNLLGSTILDGLAVRQVGAIYDHHSPIDEHDVVIAVMGPTGAGKSSFVNVAARSGEAVIGYELKSKTRVVQAVRCPHPDGRRNIVLVDTPGFDDTQLSDAQILRIIANWLKNTYQRKIILAGLLYLHRISDIRMAGTPLRNLSVFRELCGNDSLKNVVLITTMWDEVEDSSIGSRREEELLSSFWKGMVDNGSRACRYRGTYDSAWEIIGLFDLERSRQKPSPLEIQREMVDRGLQFQDTAAAKTLRRFLMHIAEDFKKTWAKLRSGTRRENGPRKPPGGPQRHRILRRTSTVGSSFSETSWASFSLSETSSVTSNDSRYLSSPAESISSSCSAAGRQDALLATITGLKFIHQLADLSSDPMLRKIIETVLRIAQLVEGMGGTHHVMSQVIENSGWLLEEITHHIMESESQLSKEMRRTLSSFQRELNSLQKVVAKMKERSPLARFLLHETDIKAMTACNNSIKAIYDKLEVKLAMENRQALLRLEEQLKTLYDSTTLRQCKCGTISVVHEEPQEYEQHYGTKDHFGAHGHGHSHKSRSPSPSGAVSKLKA